MNGFYTSPAFIVGTVITMLAAVFAAYAQSKVSSTAKRYISVQTGSGLTGAEVAQAIMNKYGVSDVRIEKSTGGFLSDHYDPGKKVVRLSEEVYSGTSITSVSVAAHEIGHVLQHADGYKMLKLRTKIVPIVSLASKLAPIVISIGFGILVFGGQNPTILGIGAILLLATVIFSLVTLPVEFDASARALKILPEISQEFDSPAVKKGCSEMLRSAAMTYIAAAAASLAELLKIVLLFMQARNRNSN
jgi:Zn-dependent membrane protease YugP